MRDLLSLTWLFSAATALRVPSPRMQLPSFPGLSTGGKKKLCFFKGDAEGTAIGSHTVFDFVGEEQSVGMVQTWNQCNEMILTSMDKRDAMLIMDTERGATKAELNLRRQQKNWNMTVDSITPMQKFSQYQQSNEVQLFGLGDAGKTVFALTHDSRAGDNVEEFVIRADSHRKYKSYTFTCHAQTRAGYRNPQYVTRTDILFNQGDSVKLIAEKIVVAWL